MRFMPMKIVFDALRPALLHKAVLLARMRVEARFAYPGQQKPGALTTMHVVEFQETKKPRHPSDWCGFSFDLASFDAELVEAAGIEPASRSTLQTVLHT